MSNNLLANIDGGWDDFYAQPGTVIQQQIEQRVCGCEYYGSSWMDAAEAMDLAALMRLDSDARFLDIGSGAGWPALYQSDKTGCDVTLTDVSLEGLKAAAIRAGQSGLEGRCRTVQTGAECLPFADDCFDAIGHADVLCCLEEKLDALSECHRVITPGGAMSFSVIHMRPGASVTETEIAAAAGPSQIGAPADYPELLNETGWKIESSRDITEGYGRTLSKLLAEYMKHADVIAVQRGKDRYKELLDKCIAKQDAVQSGIVLRSLITVTPC